MKYVKLYDGAPSRPLPFYLAMEEYLARTRQEDELWFWWIVPPTVIIGRNQLMDTEVNVPYCREHGIQVYRRKSGGGCVYSDFGNVMFSYVCHSSDVETTFRRYTTGVADMLRSLG
ncbi:MAG: lipoyltransferase, partial [Muribaculaceae bacterium]|nr:lipoyltransferase [Muribaculaceae bacterium]